MSVVKNRKKERNVIIYKARRRRQLRAVQQFNNGITFIIQRSLLLGAHCARQREFFSFTPTAIAREPAGHALQTRSFFTGFWEAEAARFDWQLAIEVLCWALAVSLSAILYRILLLYYAFVGFSCLFIMREATFKLYILEDNERDQMVVFFFIITKKLIYSWG